jgi:hypothetical protein
LKGAGFIKARLGDGSGLAVAKPAAKVSAAERRKSKAGALQQAKKRF